MDTLFIPHASTQVTDLVPKREVPAAALALVAVLEQLADLLTALTDEQYRTTPDLVASSSVGGHVRHCLDHIDALLVGAGRGVINYDRRQRGTLVESCRLTARAVIARQVRQLLALPDLREGQPMRLCGVVSSQAPPIEMATSLGRELAFVLSHTIHHNAVIAILARAQGVTIPPPFGFAPSTIAYQETNACAR